MRTSWRERTAKPELAKKERTYLARLNGRAVGYAEMHMPGAGHAYLGGAATLPEFRGQRIYSTLLRRRLEDARELGLRMATIDAEPMSRRIVTRYGFKEYGKIAIYAWMPVMDMEVIRNLVPDE
jgi:ribosomal protein S18 acetylase RimI-like enzyme